MSFVERGREDITAFLLNVGLRAYDERSVRDKPCILAYYRGVKGQRVTPVCITGEDKVLRVKGVIDRLPRGASKCLDELDLRTNPRKWIHSLLELSPLTPEKMKAARDPMEYLLNDFTESMRSRMREEMKYVVGILLEGDLLVCHSKYGEETISVDWETYARMLDSDNILRYARFYKRNGKVYVSFYEKYKTESFAEWLGLSERDIYYYYGKKIRLHTKIEGFSCVIEVDINDMERFIQKYGDQAEFRYGRIRLESPLKVISINRVALGRRKYDFFSDFLRNYFILVNNLDVYKKKFEETINSLDVYIYDYVDCKDKVIRVLGDRSELVVSKAQGKLDVIFATQTERGSAIEIEEDYVNDIVKRLVNGESIALVHIGDEIDFINPFEVGSLRIFNRLNVNDMLRRIRKYYDSAGTIDETIKRLIEYVMLSILAKINSGRHVAYILEKLASGLLREVCLLKRVVAFEDKVLEFKSRTFFEGRDRDIVERLASDINKKLSDTNLKIYVIGVEDNGVVDPILASRLKSDRIERIRSSLENRTGARITILPIENNGRAILLLVAYK